MTNPYYFTGVDDPYLEIWALTDGAGNVLLVDQNLFMIKILESHPYTNNFNLVKLSTISNIHLVKKYLNNSTCKNFRIVQNKLVKAKADTTAIRDKLLESRYKISQIIDQAPSDMLYSIMSSAFLMLQFGNDATLKEIAFTEIDRFSTTELCSKFNGLTDGSR